MRWMALVLCASSLGLAGCRVCGVGACKKEQGNVITAVVPNMDGTIKITTCKLTTKGSEGTVDACRDHVVPAPK
jgi:hypothetical protein